MDSPDKGINSPAFKEFMRSAWNVIMKSFKSFTETPVDEACWKGYEKKGMKTMFGKSIQTA